MQTCAFVLPTFGGKNVPRDIKHERYCLHVGARALQHISMFSWRSTRDTNSFNAFTAEHVRYNKSLCFHDRARALQQIACFHGGARALRQIQFFHGGARAFSVFLAEHVRYYRFHCFRSGACALSRKEPESSYFVMTSNSFTGFALACVDVCLTLLSETVGFASFW